GLVVSGAMPLALPAPRTATAQDPRRHDTQVTPFFSWQPPNVPGKTITLVLIDYPPGGTSKPHRHPASGIAFDRVELVLFRSQIEGEEVKAYGEGEYLFKPPGSHRIISENASAGEHARAIAVIIADELTASIITLTTLLLPVRPFDA